MSQFFARFVPFAIFIAVASVAHGQRANLRARDKAPARTSTEAIDPFARAAQNKARQERADAQAASENAFLGTRIDAVDDAIVLKSGERLNGAIESLSRRTGATIVLRDSSAVEPRRVAFGEIERIEAAATPSYDLGTRALEDWRRVGTKEDAQRALAFFQEARRATSSRFERALATAKVVDALTILERTDDAIDEFLLLCALDPFTPFLENAPLTWLERAPSRAAEEKLVPWLKKNENPPGRLLAASTLLRSSKYGREAADALQALATLNPKDETNADDVEATRAISLLALLQLLRLELVASPNEDAMTRLNRASERLPEKLRVGPLALGATLEKKLGRDEDAARDFLRVAYSTYDRALARYALREAADAYARIGRSDDAERLKKELARFEESFNVVP